MSLQTLLPPVNTLPPLAFTSVQTRLNEEEEQALIKHLREAGTYSVGGPEGAAFEKEFAAFIGSAEAVSLNSCSSALELVAEFTHLKPGDEVILPAHTFVASAVPFARHGVSVKWADIDPATWVISADSIAKLITAKTKLIVVVHLYGMPADMDAIMAVARSHSIPVVEDCAQAPGARYKGKRVGSMGDFGCFSFHSQKNMTTLGEGGMLTLSDPKLALAARRIRWMGNWPFEGERAKYWKPAMANLVVPLAGHWPRNYCMGEPNCVVGRLLVKRLDKINAQRQRQANRLITALRDFSELKFQNVPAGYEHVYHLMPSNYDGSKYGKKNDDLIELLFTKYNLKCIVQYWPLYRAELFREFGLGKADAPITDKHFDNMVSFPWWSDMPDALIDDMATRIASALTELRAGNA